MPSRWQGLGWSPREGSGRDRVLAMKHVLPWLLIVQIGCVPEVEKVDGWDTADTQVDTGGEECGLADLVFGAEVQDSGWPCEVCPHGVSLGFVGTITNACRQSLSMHSGGGKLVRRFSLEPLGLAGAEPLSETEIEWVMGPEEVLDEEVFDMPLPEGDYVLEFEFADLPDRHVITHAFQVRAR